MLQRSIFSLSLKTLYRRPHNEILSSRTLYSRAALGLDGYEYSCSKYREQIGKEENSFKNKMKEVVENERNAVFTDDLKSMLHLAQEEDIPLVTKMISKFENQNAQLRFGNFVFGPVVMRMFYQFNKPDEALELFKTSKGFLDQVISFQLLMDMLFNNERYKEVLEVFNIVKDKQIQGSKYPRNLIVLTFGACYKLNTPESFEYATNLWSELMRVGHSPMRRAATFAAALALNQNKPDVSLEILSTVQKKFYVTVRNLRACALSQIARLNEAVNVLEETIASDRSFSATSTISEETVNAVKQAVEKSGDQDVIAKFVKIESKLRSLNQVDKKSLDELLSGEIDRKLPPNTGDGQYDGRQRDQRRQRPPAFNYNAPRYRNHPGLSEMT